MTYYTVFQMKEKEVFMKKKTIFEAMKLYVETTLDGSPLVLIAIGAETSVDKETGEATNYVKAEAEVPKGYDALSRCRFTVKIMDAPLKVTEKQLEDADYEIKFQGLKISYIDTKGNVYFKADSYEVSIAD